LIFAFIDLPVAFPDSTIISNQNNDSFASSSTTVILERKSVSDLALHAA